MKANLQNSSNVIYEAAKTEVPYSRSDLQSRVKVLEALEYLPLASKRHIQLWIKGVAPLRDSGIEKDLKVLVDNKRSRVKAFTYKEGPALAYTTRRRINELDIAHLMGCSECMVRFYRADVNFGVDVEVSVSVISEKEFRGCGYGFIPDGGLLYEIRNKKNETIERKLLLFEYSRKPDWKRTGRFGSKIAAYRDNISKIEEEYQAKAIVVFIADVERWKVANLANEWAARDPYAGQFYFTDYETFKKVEIGQALNAEIYYFLDGKEYSLK